MPFTHNDGVRLHWEEQGEGTPVLLVMGMRFSSALWYPVIPTLAEHHRVVWYDNRGTGQSDAPRSFTLDDLVGDAVAVLDAAGIERAHAFGVSMGGGVVLEMALSRRDRVRSIVLGCTALFSAEKPRPTRLKLLLGRLPIPFWLFTTEKARLSMYGPAAPREAVDRDLEVLAVDRYSRPGVVAQAKAVGGYVVTHEAVAALEVPTLVQHGTADTTVPVACGEELAATIPGARLSLFDGAGHNYLVADTARANAEVLAFIDEVDAG